MSTETSQGAVTMTHDIDTLARRWFEGLWNERRPEVFRELVAPNAVMLSNSAGQIRSYEEFRTAIYEPFVVAFPDMQVTIPGTVVKGDQVAVRWTASGTHTGSMLGFAPTGRKFFLRGLTWLRFCDGQIVEGWDCWNRADLLEALRPAAESAAPAPRAATG
jgi:steroid delta-isomerase-like uncharacterized protein